MRVIFCFVCFYLFLCLISLFFFLSKHILECDSFYRYVSKILFRFVTFPFILFIIYFNKQHLYFIQVIFGFWILCENTVIYLKESISKCLKGLLSSHLGIFSKCSWVKLSVSSIIKKKNESIFFSLTNYTINLAQFNILPIKVTFFTMDLILEVSNVLLMGKYTLYSSNILMDIIIKGRIYHFRSEDIYYPGTLFRRMNLFLF